MVFPAWVNKARSNKAKASARLRYIIIRLAIEHSASASVRAMCDSAGLCRHSVVALYISKGAFSQRLAEKFEQHFGSDIITAAALMDPLSIETPAAAAK